MSIAELPVIDTPVPNDDEQHLASYEAKLQLVRDYTKGVALGFSNGFFLYLHFRPSSSRGRAHG